VLTLSLIDFKLTAVGEKRRCYRSRANTTMGLDFEHMIKARAHKGGVRIGKTPKN